MPSSETSTTYSVAQLKEEYKYLKEAKEAFNLKARGWAALVEKLNAPSYEQLKAQLNHFKKQNAELKKEKESLLKSISKTQDFDEVGFWLLDNNFERSRFPDFNTPSEATKLESAAKKFHKELSQRYHPDKGGTEIQMANLNLLLDQLLSLVEMNDGLGK